MRFNRRSQRHVPSTLPVSILHDVYALVVAQACKLKVFVVIILSSYKIIYQSLITLSHVHFSISHDVYTLVDATAYVWTTFLVNR